jgi:glutaconate CoA-transferase subunit B
MMAIVLSRSFVDGEFGAIGAASQIPYAALRLATLTRAPNICWLSGGSGGINPVVDELPPSSSDYRNALTAEASYSLEDVVDWETSSRLDFACLGGMQIDQYGNTNMARLKTSDGRFVRGPGTVGLVFMSTFKKVYLYTERHTTRTLVEKVDFISGAGHLSGGDSRFEHLMRRATGPVLLLTPLAVFDFPGPEHRARLVSVHPGHTVEEVLSNMSFVPVMDGDVPVTPSPTETELAVLREVVDPQGALRRTE